MRQTISQTHPQGGGVPMDPLGGCSWDPPAVVDNLAARLPASPDRRELLNVSGNFNALDVFVDVPNSWQLVELAAVAKFGATEIEVARALIQSVEHLTLTGTDLVGVPSTRLTQAGRLQGLALSVRGRASHGQWSIFGYNLAPADGPLEGGRLAARAWGVDVGVYGDRVSRLPIDPHCARTQQVSFSTAGEEGGLPAGDTIVFPLPTGNRAVHITDLELTPIAGGTDDILTLVQRDAVGGGGGDIQRAVWVVGDGHAVVSNRTRPLLGVRGFEWVIQRTGGGGGAHVNFEGFVE